MAYPLHPAKLQLTGRAQSFEAVQVWAATAGGARALRRTDIGHLGAGARADLILLDAPSHAYLAYRPGVPQIAAVWQAGRLVAGSAR